MLSVQRALEGLLFSVVSEAVVGEFASVRPPRQVVAPSAAVAPASPSRRAGALKRLPSAGSLDDSVPLPSPPPALSDDDGDDVDDAIGGDDDEGDFPVMRA